MDIFRVKDKREGAKKGLELLENWLTPNTLLFLSGGSSPQELYKSLVSSKIKLGGVATVDERFGPPEHAESNERMFAEKGIYKWADEQNVQILKVLDISSGLTETAEAYGHKISQALQNFTQKIAVMGVGSDGHTAGIAPNVSWWDTDNLVVGYEHKAADWHWPKRITLTFSALRNVNYFLVLLFGEEKRNVLERLHSNEQIDLNKFPVDFYRDVQEKTVIVTDIQ